MLKLAFVSGVSKALKDLGLIKMADDELAQLSEAVAEELPGTEEEYAEPMPEEVTSELAASLVELADSLQDSADAAQVAAAAAEEEPKSAAWLLRKLSQNPDLARGIVGSATGSTAVGGGSNTLSDSENAEANMEEEQRPEGYANTGMGVQEHGGEGLLGTEVDRTGEGGPVMADENSATATVEAKAALWRIREALRKHGVDTGATVTPDKETPDAETGEGVTEKKERPVGYAQPGLGKTQISGGEIGHQEQHEKQEDHEGTSNEAAKVSEEQEYIRQIRKLGQKYAHALPFYMTDTEKIAALQYLAGISPAERTAVIRHIEKTGELPEGLREYVEKKKEHEEKETAEEEATEEKAKAEEKAKEQEKKSALLRRLRRLSM